MIDKNQLEWGMRPFRELDALAVYGARAIFQHGTIDIPHDRQRSLGGESAQGVLRTWIGNKAFPALKDHIRTHAWTSTTQDVFKLETWNFLFESSPRGSDGYLYISAYLKGLEAFPEPDGEKLRWSGKFIPEIGDQVDCAVNGIGQGVVLGYFIENGWIGVMVKPANPPEWHIRQNGRNAVCGLFGAEIRKC